MTERQATDQAGEQAFRSPAAIAIWWVWALFALGNLIDLAVQGRDHLALTAAFVLLFVTGIVYVTALRPRVVAGPGELTIVNPLGEHRIGWAAVAGADPTDLLRVRCEWPDGDRTGRRAFYAWAVHSSRRRQIAAELRVARQDRRGPGAGGGFGAFAGGAGGGFGWGRPQGAQADPAREADSLRIDADRVVTVITEHAERARLDPLTVPAAPASAWNWPAFAAVVVPGLAMLVVLLT